MKLKTCNFLYIKLNGNFKHELSPSKPLLHSTQSPILSLDILKQKQFDPIVEQKQFYQVCDCTLLVTQLQNNSQGDKCKSCSFLDVLTLPSLQGSKTFWRLLIELQKLLSQTYLIWSFTLEKNSFSKDFHLGSCQIRQQDLPSLFSQDMWVQGRTLD